MQQDLNLAKGQKNNNHGWQLKAMVRTSAYECVRARTFAPLPQNKVFAFPTSPRTPDQSRMQLPLPHV